jgi:hypothetical protein
MFRARLSLFALEARENPSVPGADPYGGDAPPPVDPPPPPVDPVQQAIDAAAAGASVPTTPPPVDPLLGDNSVYKIPLTP